MAAGYRVIQDIDDKGFSEVDISSLTVAEGDLLELTAGATTWVLTTSSSNFFTRKAIAREAATTAATVLKVYECNGKETVEVQSANNSSASDNGDRMAATDEDTVNNSGTDVSGQAVVFVQDKVKGEASDKTIIGKVLVGNGVDPDAA